jgi:hypothetical protein
MDMTTTELEPYDVLVGEWEIELAHPAIDGAMRGTASIEWLEGRAFLIQRATAEHPDAPDALWVIGPGPDGLQADYYDSRGVRRVYATSLRDRELRLWRAAPGFSQRFVGRISDDGREIDGLWQLCRDDAAWDDDLRMRFARRQDRSPQRPV